MKKVLVILRGIPRAGKNSFAELLGRAICCADDWHTHKGKYNWLPQNVGTAHAWCQRKCWRFMQKDISPIIIANTNTTEKDIEIYIKYAKCFGYKIFSVVLENRHNGINIHSVPVETIEKMKNRLMNSIKL